MSLSLGRASVRVRWNPAVSMTTANVDKIFVRFFFFFSSFLLVLKSEVFFIVRQLISNICSDFTCVSVVDHWKRNGACLCISLAEMH